MANVVVVDDDADAAEALGEIMTAEGHDVRLAFDGREALTLIEARYPDVVLMDVEMPVLDGPGLACGLVAHDCGMEDIPLVLLSGVDDLAAVAKRVGTPYHLTKPYRYEPLLELVRRALRERRAPTPSASSPGP